MKTRFISFLLLLAMGVSAFAQSSSYQPTEENLKARQEFQDNKFGIFLHWGLYAMLATGEWTMTNNNLDYKEYAKLAGGFYPSKFDADKWVEAIKASGAKYICFTTRHLVNDVMELVAAPKAVLAAISPSLFWRI